MNFPVRGRSGQDSNASHTIPESETPAASARQGGGDDRRCEGQPSEWLCGQTEKRSVVWFRSTGRGLTWGEVRSQGSFYTTEVDL
jgi:hypothetical protein